MKGTLACILIVVGHLSAIGEAPPAELAAAHARYEAAVAVATKPLKERYLEELKRMKEKALFDRKADLAVAIDTEIKVLGGAPVTGADLRGRLTNTTWKWWDTETITFLPENKIRWSHDQTQLWTWKVTDPAKRIIEGNCSKGTFRLQVGDDLKSGKLSEGGGAARSTEQISAP